MDNKDKYVLNKIYSSSLSSTLSVLIFTLIGSDMIAIHSIYIYFGLITIAIVVAVILYLKAESKKLSKTGNQ